MISPLDMNAPAKSRNHVHLDLAVESLRQFSEVRFVAHGTSMLPAIFPGDCLTVKSLGSSSPNVGDVVLVRRSNEFRVHRVARIIEDQLQTTFILRGDSLPHEDPPVSRGEILGRVTSRLRAGKSLQLSSSDSIPQRVLRSVVRRSSIVVGLLLRWNARKTQRSQREGLPPAISADAHLECN